VGVQCIQPQGGVWARAAGVIFIAAVLAGFAAPILAALRLTEVIGPGGLPGLALASAGLLLAVAGFVVAALAQQEMGRSWRIGVDPAEKTELVTGSLFAVVRNPIFTAVIVAQAGTVLLAPTWLGLAGVILLTVACQLQVRKVEEPYLTRTHGRRYAEYTRQVGRFLPR
jgi:protein-S-isoprenylcysteine O-methyltransferase Ste14